MFNLIYNSNIPCSFPVNFATIRGVFKSLHIFPRFCFLGRSRNRICLLELPPWKGILMQYSMCTRKSTSEMVYWPSWMGSVHACSSELVGGPWQFVLRLRAATCASSSRMRLPVSSAGFAGSLVAGVRSFRPQHRMSE